MAVREFIAETGLRALENQQLERPDLLRLTDAAGAHAHEIMYWAHRVRQQNFGNEVRLCSIVPGKLGACAEDCKWCAQSIHSDTPEGGKGGALAKPKRTSVEQMLSAARDATRNRATSLGIVNSGRRASAKDLAAVTEAIACITSDNRCDIEACASLGDLSGAQARQLAAAGVTRYNHNLETSRRHFPNVVTSHGYQERIETLKNARQAGMKLCSGGLFGIGETWEDRVDLLLAIRDEVSPDVTPLNFLHPVPGTPLGNATPLAPMEILAIIAIARLTLPMTDIKVAGGRSHNLGDLQSWIFYAGATSCMIGNYLTTAGRDVQTDLKMIDDLGLKIVKEFYRRSASHQVSV